MYVLRSKRGSLRGPGSGTVWTFAVLVLLALLAGCGGSDNPTDPDDDDDDDDPTEASILISAMHDDWGVGEVEIDLTGPGGETHSGTTDTDGSIEFDDLADGTWEVEISPPAWFDLASGQSASREIALSGAQREVSIQLAPVVEQETVEIETTANLEFSIEELVVAPGTRVRWFNEQAMEHTVTPNGHSAWTSGTLPGAGYDFVVVFNNPGDYPYFCSPHQAQGMTGEVTVEP